MSEQPSADSRITELEGLFLEYERILFHDYCCHDDKLLNERAEQRLDAAGDAIDRFAKILEESPVTGIADLGIRAKLAEWMEYRLAECVGHNDQAGHNLIRATLHLAGIAPLQANPFFKETSRV
jgi:hypothetical protein